MIRNRRQEKAQKTSQHAQDDATYLVSPASATMHLNLTSAVAMAQPRRAPPPRKGPPLNPLHCVEQVKGGGEISAQSH